MNGWISLGVSDCVDESVAGVGLDGGEGCLGGGSSGSGGGEREGSGETGITEMSDMSGVSKMSGIGKSGGDSGNGVVNVGDDLSGSTGQQTVTEQTETMAIGIREDRGGDHLIGITLLSLLSGGGGSSSCGSVIGSEKKPLWPRQLRRCRQQVRDQQG